MLKRLLRIAVLGAAMASVGCQPGLGHQVSAHDFAFAFTQRDDITIRTLSSPQLRAAVWDRLEGPEEFRRVAAILGHGQEGEVVDSQFRDTEAIIQYRTPEHAQYRLHLIYDQDDWKVDDVLKEMSPGVYASMRRQAEAVLAVRDFRRAIERRDRNALAQASSEALSRDTWRRMNDASMDKAAPLLTSLLEGTAGEVGDVFEPEHEKFAARVGARDRPYTFYFVTERGRLVIDDVAVPGSPSPLRAILRDGPSA